jgi:hypothetical protein
MLVCWLLVAVAIEVVQWELVAVLLAHRACLLSSGAVGARKEML